MANSNNIFGYPEPQGCRDLVKRLIVAILIMFAMFWLMAHCTSCASQKPCIPTIEYKVRDSISHHYHHDTTRIYTRDSVIIREKGDTIFVDHWRDRWLERIVVQKDSASNSADEQQVQTVEVVPDYYKNCAWVMWILVAAIALYIVAKILIRIYVKH